MPKRIRTFIAVEISRAVRRRIVALERELAPSILEIKWVEPENIHLTLKFLGEVDEPDLYGVCKAAQELVADLAPFQMTVAGVGAFPHAKRPRVIWAGVTEGNPQLTTIHDSLEDWFAGQGYVREDRLYTPHLTLGRIRRTVPNSELEPALERQRGWEGGQTAVAEILVMASRLSSGGPHYVVMGRGKLGGER